jgi:hypothetical protein
LEVTNETALHAAMEAELLGGFVLSLCLQITAGEGERVEGCSGAGEVMRIIISVSRRGGGGGVGVHTPRAPVKRVPSWSIV